MIVYRKFKWLKKASVNHIFLQDTLKQEVRYETRNTIHQLSRD
jgi:hypothetical protein